MSTPVGTGLPTTLPDASAEALLPGGVPAGRRVLVVTLDQLTQRMAGPAIRAWEISRLLAGEHDVVLATFGACERAGEGFRTRHVEVGDFRAVVEAADVVVLQGFVMATFPWMQDCPQVIVVDLYDPFHIESLEVGRFNAPEQRDASLASALRELEAQVRRGDLFLCASDRQRDLWVGHLAAAGRINRLTYDADPTLDALVRIAPFGIAADPPVQQRHAIKGAVPGIGPDDKVVLWGGGVYNWFDPLTLVRAVDVVRVRVPEVRLYFLGMKHPNPDVPEMRMAVRLRALADELGLTGTHVFFNEDWVPYETRADHLLDADVGVSCHFPHLETEFSFRTRMLDYLWAGLPMVCTDGDWFAGLVERERLGRVVPAEDPAALAAALEQLLADDAGRAATVERVRAVAERFRWARVLGPLADFCRAPVRAADAERMGSDAPPPGRSRGQQLRADLVTVVRHVRAGRFRHLVTKVRMRAARG